MLRNRVLAVGGIATAFTTGMLAGSLMLGSAFAAGPSTPLPSTNPSVAQDIGNIQSNVQGGAQVQDATPDGVAETTGEAKGAPEVDAPGGANLQVGGQQTGQH